MKSIIKKISSILIKKKYPKVKCWVYFDNKLEAHGRVMSEMPIRLDDQFGTWVEMSGVFNKNSQ